MDSMHANFGTSTIWFLWVTPVFIILAVEEIAALSSRILWMKFQNLQHSQRNTTQSEMSERSQNDETSLCNIEVSQVTRKIMLSFWSLQHKPSLVRWDKVHHPFKNGSGRACSHMDYTVGLEVWKVTINHRKGGKPARYCFGQYYIFFSLFLLYLVIRFESWLSHVTIWNQVSTDLPIK